jgi:hypothetical protein
MPEEWTKDKCIQTYNECKIKRSGSVPAYREFLRHSGINGRQLIRLFGSSAYSRLQTAAGDDPNKLQLERTPLARIMEQYGSLVIELNALPTGADWEHRGFRPAVEGLRKKPHQLKWTELPSRFVEWVESNHIAGFERALQVIRTSDRWRISVREDLDPGFVTLVRDIRHWTPARRRNSEGEYKIELRKHLESLKYELNEEFGESKFDLLVRSAYAIEVKKDPDLSEYDRLFGQIARHLQHQQRVICLIVEATRGDRYDNFAALVDKYFNLGGTSVEIIKK